MSKCYFCGGFIETKHRVDADIGDKKSPAHRNCAKRNDALAVVGETNAD